MENAHDQQVGLEPWDEGDLWLLRRTNAPEMTEHLGGPETEEQLVARHRRYVEMSGPGRMYRVVAAGAGGTVGSIGFWEREWRGEKVWETGWGCCRSSRGAGWPCGRPEPSPRRPGRPAGTAICTPSRGPAKVRPKGAMG
jgi:RimJ/RimL family protein N-acetyltransferase